jgi:hypothetical protein
MRFRSLSLIVPLLGIPLTAALSTPAWAAGPHQAGAATTAERLEGAKPFAVFVDEETRFAFVRTPSKWRFVRQLDREQMSRLHPETIVATLADRRGDDALLAAQMISK